MLFKEKLKEAMQQLGINQVKVASLTRKSKGSISQYLSGKQVPTAEGQREIAIALGLVPDYFEQNEDSVLKLLHSGKNGEIKKLVVTEAAKLLGMNHNTVRKGLQQGVFPWGYAIRTSEHQWTYFINAKRFAEIERIVDESEKGEENGRFENNRV